MITECQFVVGDRVRLKTTTRVGRVTNIRTAHRVDVTYPDTALVSKSIYVGVLELAPDSCEGEPT